MPWVSCLNQTSRPRSSKIMGPPRTPLIGRGAAKTYPGATPAACLVTSTWAGCRSGRVRKDLLSPAAWASVPADAAAGGVGDTDGGAASAVLPASPPPQAVAVPAARVNAPTATPARRPGRTRRRRAGCREGAMGGGAYLEVMGREVPRTCPERLRACTTSTCRLVFRRRTVSKPRRRASPIVVSLPAEAPPTTRQAVTWV